MSPAEDNWETEWGQAALHDAEAEAQRQRAAIMEWAYQEGFIDKDGEPTRKTPQRWERALLDTLTAKQGARDG